MSLRFKNYITEAKVTKANFSKAAEIFKRIYEKNTGSRFFRHGGPGGFVGTNKGVGILYYSSDREAFRLNYEDGQIKSITKWNKFSLGNPGDYTIDLDGLSLSQAGKEVIRIIKNPQIGTHRIIPDLQESVELDVELDEAKQVSPENFISLAMNTYGQDKIQRMTWDEIVYIAKTNDVTIPTIIRQKTKIPGTRGKNSRFDLGLINSSNVKPADTKKTEKDYYIKVTARDPNSNKFSSVIGDARAEDILNTIKKSIENPVMKKELKDPNSLFSIMRDLVRLVARKNRNALLIYGGPGIGKTFNVTATLKEEGLKKNQDWYLVKGKITTAALYQTLFMHRDGKIIVFDDTDSVWNDAEASNILKAALDSYDERTISWSSSRTVNVGKMSAEDIANLEADIDEKLESDPTKVKFPSEFEFKSRIIFISNLAREKFDQAVLSRSAKIDMTLTPEQIFIRMRSLVKEGVLGSKLVSTEAKLDILDFLEKEGVSKGLKLEEINFRTFVAAEDCYLSGIGSWKDLISHM